MSDPERPPGSPPAPAGGETRPEEKTSGKEGPGEGVGAVQPPTPAEGGGEPTRAGAEQEAAARADAAAAAGVPEAKEAAPAPPAKPAKAPLSPEEKAALVAKAKAAKEAAAGGAGAAAPAAKPKPHHEEDPNKPAWEKDPVAPEWQDAADDPLAAALREELGEELKSARRFAGDLTLAVDRKAVARAAESLKRRHGFTYLVDVCGADYPQRTPRFDVVYHLYSFAANRRVRLKIGVGEGEEVPSLATVFRAANWPEREVYDMYGVRFAGHPDMTRILLWEGFNGYPLRKDFPVEGIDTGSAIYPEYYEERAGPVAGAGTGWKPGKPPEASS